VEEGRKERGKRRRGEGGEEREEGVSSYDSTIT
jgi:hypothetical protein